MWKGAGHDRGLAAIGRSTDAQAWTTQLKFQDIAAPVSCPTGTEQRDTCEELWCGLASQLGITSTVIDCTPRADAATPDAGTAPPAKPGCCGVGADPVGMGAFALLVAAGLGLPRRRRRSP